MSRNASIPGWPDDPEIGRAPLPERREQDERPAEGVIGVEMADEDDVDIVELLAGHVQIPQHAGRRLDENALADQEVAPISSSSMETSRPQKGERDGLWHTPDLRDQHGRNASLRSLDNQSGR